jgi:hypothetical protein
MQNMYLVTTNTPPNNLYNLYKYKSQSSEIKILYINKLQTQVTKTNQPKYHMNKNLRPSHSTPNSKDSCSTKSAKFSASKNFLPILPTTNNKWSHSGKSGITNHEKGQFLFVGLNMTPIYLGVNFFKQCRNILKALIPIVEPYFKFL